MLELTAELIERLMKFVIFRENKTEAHQFMELHRKWTQVVDDLREVDRMECLNNSLIIKFVSSKLSSEGCQLRCMEITIVFQDIGKSELEIVELF